MTNDISQSIPQRKHRKDDAQDGRMAQSPTSSEKAAKQMMRNLRQAQQMEAAYMKSKQL